MSCYAADRSDFLDLFCTRSRHLFRADDDMAAGVYGRALLLASVTFLESGRARSLKGQPPLPKNANLQHDTHWQVAATENANVQCVV